MKHIKLFEGFGVDDDLQGMGNLDEFRFKLNAKPKEDLSLMKDDINDILIDVYDMKFTTRLFVMAGDIYIQLEMPEPCDCQNCRIKNVKNKKIIIVNDSTTVSKSILSKYINLTDPILHLNDYVKKHGYNVMIHDNKNYIHITNYIILDGPILNIKLDKIDDNN